MKIVELFKTLMAKFDEDDSEKKALESRVYQLSRIMSEIMKQYRSFRLLSPAILREASETLSEISPEVRTVFESQSLSLDDVDVVPRREFVTLAESYNRINSQYLKLVEEMEKAKRDEEGKPEPVKETPPAKIAVKRKPTKKPTRTKK